MIANDNNLLFSPNLYVSHGDDIIAIKDQVRDLLDALQGRYLTTDDKERLSDIQRLIDVILMEGVKQ